MSCDDLLYRHALALGGQERLLHVLVPTPVLPHDVALYTAKHLPKGAVAGRPWVESRDSRLFAAHSSFIFFDTPFSTLVVTMASKRPQERVFSDGIIDTLATHLAPYLERIALEMMVAKHETTYSLPVSACDNADAELLCEVERRHLWPPLFGPVFRAMTRLRVIEGRQPLPWTLLDALVTPLDNDSHRHTGSCNTVAGSLRSVAFKFPAAAMRSESVGEALLRLWSQFVAECPVGSLEPIIPVLSADEVTQEVLRQIWSGGKASCLERPHVLTANLTRRMIEQTLQTTTMTFIQGLKTASVASWHQLGALAALAWLSDAAALVVFEDGSERNLQQWLGAVLLNHIDTHRVPLTNKPCVHADLYRMLRAACLHTANLNTHSGVPPATRDPNTGVWSFAEIPPPSISFNAIVATLAPPPFSFTELTLDCDDLAPADMLLLAASSPRLRVITMHALQAFTIRQVWEILSVLGRTAAHVRDVRLIGFEFSVESALWLGAAVPSVTDFLLVELEHSALGEKEEASSAPTSAFLPPAHLDFLPTGVMFSSAFFPKLSSLSVEAWALSDGFLQHPFVQAVLTDVNLTGPTTDDTIAMLSQGCRNLNALKVFGESMASWNSLVSTAKLPRLRELYIDRINFSVPPTPGSAEVLRSIARWTAHCASMKKLHSWDLNLTVEEAARFGILRSAVSDMELVGPEVDGAHASEGPSDHDHDGSNTREGSNDDVMHRRDHDNQEHADDFPVDAWTAVLQHCFPHLTELTLENVAPALAPRGIASVIAPFSPLLVIKTCNTPYHDDLVAVAERCPRIQEVSLSECDVSPFLQQLVAAAERKLFTSLVTLVAISPFSELERQAAARARREDRGEDNEESSAAFRAVDERLRAIGTTVSSSLPSLRRMRVLGYPGKISDDTMMAFARSGCLLRTS